MSIRVCQWRAGYAERCKSGSGADLGKPTVEMRQGAPVSSLHIDRHHIHIVSLRVRPDGSAIDSKNNYYRSKEITRELERKYGLHTAERQRIDHNEPIKKIDPSGDIKRQVANTVKMVGMRYKFQTIGEYNAILSLYNIRCEQADGRVNGREYHGLVYFATDDAGNTIASPLKASRLGKFAGREAIEQKYVRSKEKINIRPTKAKVTEAMAQSSSKEDFIVNLKAKNIELILRYTDAGRIYGATFIDHNTMTVLNGSKLGKEFSANALEQWFSNGEKPEIVPVRPVNRQSDNEQSQTGNTQSGDTQSNPSGERQQPSDSDTDNPPTPPQGQRQTQSNHGQGNSQVHGYDDTPILPGLDLFQTGPGFNAEEEAFYRAMQRRKKKKRRGPKL